MSTSPMMSIVALGGLPAQVGPVRLASKSPSPGSLDTVAATGQVSGSPGSNILARRPSVEEDLRLGNLYRSRFI